MPEAHDASPVGQGLPDPGVGLGRRLDLLHHEHDLLVGASVQRALEGADGRDDGGVHVGHGGRGDAGGEGGGVELVIRVEDERHVEGLGGQRARRLAGEHAQEVRGQALPWVGRDQGPAAADALPGGHQGGHLRGEPQGLAQRRLARVVGGIGIERREGRDAGAQHLHGRGLPGQLAQHGDQLGRKAPVGRGGQRLHVGLQLLPGRQRAVPEQVHDLLERGVLDEIIDVVSAIEQAPLAPIDEANLGGGNDHILEASLELAASAHTRPSPLRCENGFLLSYVHGPFKAGLGAHRVDILDFYDRHPISEPQVLAAVARHRGGSDGPLSPDDLFEFDQDHYGGLAAVEALAVRARIAPDSRVLDVCAGLGGPARVLATRRLCRVIGIELNAGRAAGAARRPRGGGLAARVRSVRGDARWLPFADASFDACISQEAFLHIADKLAVLNGCHRVLRPGGRLAFTDWIAHSRLADRERERLREWMAATTLQSLDGYRGLLGRAGFTRVDAEDLTEEWAPLLRRRLALYRRLERDAVTRIGAVPYRDYVELHEFFVGLVVEGKLGGGRFWASR